ncbi:hypothetical protein AXG93_669s1010 [Marchantia polymorpha subsp. ruderalis]|uniref:Uncharacterized protein n=1 Tax=Marchantia polymorpha subsp. ruderalis TaxID=1480154 RepID=A0A176WB70_MARPO|nr:hypothetical protein AXG93_669s1010 [Marchantia polymorpha subsp. ruderalis]
MSEAAASTTDEDMKVELNLWMGEAGPSGVQNEAPMKEEVEPSEERTATESLSLPPLEREEVVVQVGGKMVDFPEIPSSPPQEKAVRLEVGEKDAEEESKELVVSFPDFLQDSVVPLLKYLDGKREKYDIPKKEMECEVLRLNLAKEKECRAEEEQVIKGSYSAVRGVADKSKKAEAEFRQLREETTDSLRLRIEKCLRGFVMWEVQTLKWLKLDLLERRLMAMKTNGAAGHKQFVRLVNSFSFDFEESRKNLELEILSVLRRLGADGSSKDAVTAASDGTAPKSSLPRTVEMSRSSE